jgi:hypothetical protein
VTVDYDEKERWLILNRENLRIVVNLADATQHVSLPEAEPSSDWRLLLTTDDETKLLGTKLLGTSVALPARSAAIVRAR